ncbi:hypothetical protein N7471_001258 [Penicillium samsonianum]|uniref:uncharacterized protein n=1 Tax=Penicillium samsonianum TaxID=1882272 RepID=UPI0025466BA0|nr:uncharacterized protein N7471_001258 [Penicillium samsonianum]KAJ6150059.1 hypothetical protein N7471_001258 [Penicillium samsonianum]
MLDYLQGLDPAPGLSSQNTQLGKNRRNLAKAPGPGPRYAPGPSGWSAHMRTSAIVTPSGSSAGSILITPKDPHSASAAATSSEVASGRRAARAVVAEMLRRRERVV